MVEEANPLPEVVICPLCMHAMAHMHVHSHTNHTRMQRERGGGGIKCKYFKASVEEKHCLIEFFRWSNKPLRKKSQ